jgi:hypothetical protein
MIIVNDILIEEAVGTERFGCDLAQCKGACCTLPGGRGAPLLDEEKGLVERALPVVRKHLSARSLNEIELRGAVDGVRGSYATTCIDDRDCVFVVYEGDVAKCSIEAAFLRGEYPWRKPVSCHLFPLRYSANGGGLLRYEAISECAPGRSKGKAEGIPLHEFLKDALIRRFGPEFYSMLSKRIAGMGVDAAEPGPDVPGSDRTGAATTAGERG